MENKIPSRNEIAEKDKWDLTSLFSNDREWETALNEIKVLADKVESFKGKIAENPDLLESALAAYSLLQQKSELTGNYAFLLTAGDASDSKNQEKYSLYMMTASDAEAKVSFLEPEIQSVPEEKLDELMKKPEYADYVVFLKKLLRLKPYILSDKEERLLAMQAESNETAHKAFSMLTNVDINYGTVGTTPLSQTTWSMFMENPDRKIRKEAYTKFYNAFDSHKNTIATLYAGSVNLDIYQARSRGYNSSLEAALFPDKVPVSVYNNLISTVRANLAPLHKYYKIRRKLLKLGDEKLKHYDVYVPLVPDVKKITPYNDAVNILEEALSPLGKEYTDILCNGLRNGWVDKYENKGKRSGAFSSGGYTGYPYILLNYKEDVLRDVFTLAHEGGHSMHSWYSSHNNPFLQYNYTIFEAEVASTFNEELLFQYYLKNETDEKVKTWLIVNRAADILATMHRQTMFAEYEKKTHELVENNIPLTVDTLRHEYLTLLKDYFGPEMEFEETSDLEGLRIPHFYSAFYVYKYATGISAALALADRVLNGGKEEKDAYFAFLKSGGSRYPIESLKVAGVDMESTEPIEAAIAKFSALIDQMDMI